MSNPDVVYLAHNRLEFTNATFGMLVANTDWSMVNRLIVYDDGSVDGTYEWLLNQARVVRRTNNGSPVAVMLDHLEHDDAADWFVKIDNDVALPEGWLAPLLSVRDNDPTLDLIGFEVGMTRVPEYRSGSVCVEEDWDGHYGSRACTHIGGVGLMRTRVFRDSAAGAFPLTATGGRNGFTEWQHHHKTQVLRAWIEPDLRAPLLDRVPVDPWASLSDRYIEEGWQRPWAKYDPAMMDWAYQWLPEAL